MRPGPYVIEITHAEEFGRNGIAIVCDLDESPPVCITAFNYDGDQATAFLSLAKARELYDTLWKMLAKDSSNAREALSVEPSACNGEEVGSNPTAGSE